MRNKLILLPGWGLGSLPLEVLAEALRRLDEHLLVEIEPLPELDSGDCREWLLELDERLPPYTWLGGWSLGGMLASELAALRGERCCGLLTLASNPCFVAHDEWPHGMPEATFNEFYQGFQDNPAATLKRFSLLCSQGAADPRALARQLNMSAPHASAEQLLAGLQVLASFDSRDAIQRYAGPQLHLFAGGDALVPAEVAEALLTLQPDIEVGLLEEGSHAFPLERPHEVAAAIDAFLTEVRDD